MNELPISKWRCGSCGRDESVKLNHVYTVVHRPDNIVLLRGLVTAQALEGRRVYCCSIECGLKEVGKWAGSGSAEACPERERRAQNPTQGAEQ